MDATPTHESGEDSTERVRLTNWALLGAIFVTATGFTWALLRPASREPLERAADVIAAPEPEPEMLSAEGVPVPVPTRPELGRRGLVSIALDARSGGHSREDLELVLARMLKLDPPAARCAVTALGLAEPVHPPAPRAVQAAQEAVSWIEAREDLTGPMGLTDSAAESVRGVICRRAVESAFESDESLDRARTALARFGEMIDAQVEGVLVMAAAIRLAEVGARACPAIARIEDARPQVAARLAGAAGCTNRSKGR